MPAQPPTLDRSDRARVAAVWIGAAAFIGVLVLPWLVPMPSIPIQSESLAVGFSNRVAMLALGIATLAMLALAARDAGLGGATSNAVISPNPAPADDRVSRRLLRVVIALALIAVLGQGIILGVRPHGDAAYFIDRLMLMSADQAPYADFEFSYGPVLIYAPWILWQALRWAGVTVQTAYYAWVALCYAIAMGLTAHVLDHVQMSRSLRNCCFALIASMTLLNPTLGVNYSALRFLLPYFALLWVDRVVGTSTRRLVRWGAPALAVAAVAAVTPEMGIALGVAIAGMAAFRWFRRPHAHGVHVPVLILGAIAVASAVILAQQGTIAAFAVGAFYLPILPGQPALVFISSVLLLSWATGQGIRTFETRDAALHVGWFIIAVALIVPAFGRADFAHMFWNGLGAIIGAIAVAGQRWRAGAFYFAAVATTFLIAVFAFTATYSLEPITDGMRRLVYGSEQRATMAATLIGRPPEKAKGRWQQIEEERARQQHAADVIAGFPKLAYSAILWGEGAEGIARSGNLVPVYSFPTRALTVSEFERDLADLEAADTMVMPTADYVACRTAAEGAEPGVDGIVMTVPHAVGSAEYYGQLAAFPVALHGRNQMLDSAASFGLVIERDWRAYKTVATYTILRRR